MFNPNRGNSQTINIKGNRVLLTVVLLLLILIMIVLWTDIRNLVWVNAAMLELTRPIMDLSVDDEVQSARRAEILIRQATSSTNGNNSAMIGLGYALVIQGREDSAIDVWKNAGVKAEDLIARGEQERKADRYFQAAEWFRRASLLDPTLGDSWYYLGWMYGKTDQRQSAIQAFAHAQSLTLEDVGLSDIFYQKGKTYIQFTKPVDFDLALESLNLALNTNQFSIPFNEIDAHFQRGDVYRMTGFPQEAIQEFEWVINNKPNFYYAFMRLGYLVWNVDQDETKAEELFRSALEIDSNRFPAYLGLAIIFQESGRDLDALEMYQEVLKYNPENEFAKHQIEIITNTKK